MLYRKLPVQHNIQKLKDFRIREKHNNVRSKNENVEQSTRNTVGLLIAVSKNIQLKADLPN